MSRRTTRSGLLTLILASVLAAGCSSGGGGGGGDNAAASLAPIDGTYAVTATSLSTCSGAIAGESETTMITIQQVADDGMNGNVRIVDEDGRVVAIGFYNASAGLLEFMNSATIHGETKLLEHSFNWGELSFPVQGDATQLSFSGAMMEEDMDEGCVRNVSLMGTMVNPGPPLTEALPLLVRERLFDGDSVMDSTRYSDDRFDSTCATTGAGDRAVLFQATGAGQYAFSLGGSEPGYDHVLAAYTLAMDAPGDQIACDDLPGDAPSELILDLTENEKVILVVDGGSTPGTEPTGDFQLSATRLTGLPAPACSSMEVFVGAEAMIGSTTPETDDFDPACGSTGGRDVAFHFVAPTNGLYVLDTIGSSFDTMLTAYESDCATEITCNDDWSSLQSRIEVDLVAGEQIVVVVDGYSASSHGDYVLNIAAPSQVLYRVNTGGYEVPATDGGMPWAEDSWSISSPYSNHDQTVAAYWGDTGVVADGTVPSHVPTAVFHSERWDPADGEEMQWSFPVDPGEYEVRLFFAENSVFGAGSRVFNVWSPGQSILWHFDISATVGDYVGTMHSTTVNITSGELEINFQHYVENPIICGIEIVRQ